MKLIGQIFFPFVGTARSFFVWSVDLLNDGNLNESRKGASSFYAFFPQQSCVHALCIYLQSIEKKRFSHMRSAEKSAL